MFYIRYSEEKVRFGEICKFKTEVETENMAQTDKSTNGSTLGDAKFYLEAELFFKEASQEEIDKPASVELIQGDKDLEKF